MVRGTDGYWSGKPAEHSGDEEDVKGSEWVGRVKIQSRGFCKADKAQGGFWEGLESGCVSGT